MEAHEPEQPRLFEGGQVGPGGERPAGFKVECPECPRLRERIGYLEGLLARRLPKRKRRPGSDGGEFARTDDLPAAVAGADHVEETEGPIAVLRPGSHRHLALRVYCRAYPEELTATEAGARATPGHDRVTGATRRTYDLSARGLILRGERGFTITTLGRRVLEQLDRGMDVRLEQPS